jgi:hypothetical protein
MILAAAAAAAAVKNTIYSRDAKPVTAVTPVTRFSKL